MTRLINQVSMTFAMIFIVALGFAGAAHAALYGDFMDPSGTVSYLNVADVNGLYGAPSVSLNSIDFTPRILWMS